MAEFIISLIEYFKTILIFGFMRSENSDSKRVPSLTVSVLVGWGRERRRLEMGRV
jgi:hypothetical protein